ncbi:diguanylate cyclase (GGDEF)-like protein/PAS domain S-box-containing protein [Salibacterium salarium]|uniref:diguanylate cyclase domain-containing protein n=1 Tax=Salibacterium salarium TaxID=284579 RepID=UPI002784DA94|nr:diguanylate cyclase [Salibacterium salarium]MDQ0300181.1 diguanylate cyclase (GGDEF)-like protein/PAS domain S-box-containing protein [Salibacterium salarium]
MWVSVLSVFYFLVSGAIFYLSVETYVKNKKSNFHRITALLLLCVSFLFITYFLKLTLPNTVTKGLIVFLEFPLSIIKFCLITEWFRMMLTSKSLYLQGFLKRWGMYLPAVLIIPLFPIDGWLVESIEHYALAQYIEFGPLMRVYSYLYILYAGYIFWMFFQAKKRRSVESVSYPLLQYFQIGFILYFFWGLIFGALFIYADFLKNVPLLVMYGDLLLIGSIQMVMKKYDFLPHYEKRYQILFEESPIAIILIDKHLQIKDANKQTEELFQRKMKSLIGTSLIKFVPRETFNYFRKKWQMAGEGSTGLRNYELTLKHSVTKKDVHLVLDSQFIELDNKMMKYIMIQDVTQSRINEQEVMYLAYHDTLTGLANRYSFNQKAETLLAQTKQSKNNNLSLLLVDLDNFKQINDTFGHDTGDKVIQHVSQLMKDLLPETGFASRLGGDEFAILFLESDRTISTEAFVEKFLKRMKEPFWAEFISIPISCSIGISYATDEVYDVNQLQKQSDRAMYTAKRDGKSTFKKYGT